MNLSFSRVWSKAHPICCVFIVDLVVFFWFPKHREVVRITFKVLVY